MDKKNIIYIGIASLVCLVVFYFFYKNLSHSSKDSDLSNSVERPKYPSFILSKGALEQASRVPEDQDEEAKQDESETSNEEPDNIEAFFDGWDIQRNSFGGITSVMSSSKEKNIPLPDDENSQTGNVLLWAQDVAPLFGGRSNQISNSSQVTGTDLTKHYSFKQVIDSYEVYDRSLQVSVNQTDGSVFSVINSLTEINMENLNLDVQRQACSNYNREQAWQRVRDMFPSATTITDITMTDTTIEEYEKPQLFVEDSVQELAWIFSVKLTVSQLDVKRVLIGCISMKPLYNQSTLN